MNRYRLTFHDHAPGSQSFEIISKTDEVSAESAADAWFIAEKQIQAGVYRWLGINHGGFLTNIEAVAKEVA